MKIDTAAVWMKILRNNSPPIKNLLDIGCRDLCSSLEIAKWLKENYFGVDVDLKMIALAKKKHPYNANIRVVSTIDFGLCFGRTFDTILMSCVMYHLNDYQAYMAFRALAKLLDPLGRAYININTTETSPQKWGDFPFVCRPVTFYENIVNSKSFTTMVNNSIIEVELGIKNIGSFSDYGYNLPRATSKNTILMVTRKH